MRSDAKTWNRQKGQTMTETLLLLPLFFLFVFGLVQMGQLAMALLVTNYGASTVVRRMVQEDRTSPPNDNDQQRFRNLLVAGMKYGGLNSKSEPDANANSNGATLFTNLTVHACVEVQALPLVGQFLWPIMRAKYAGQSCDDNFSKHSMGPFAFHARAPHYYFIVHGQATARMNYQPPSGP